MKAIEIVECKGVAPPGGLYSHISRINSGNIVMIAGQLSIAPDGSIVGAGDLIAQIKQVFANLSAALASAGAGFKDVAKFTTFLTRDTDIPIFSEQRKGLFATLYPDKVYPPNTLVVVHSLVRPEFLIEIEAMAVTAS